MTLEEWVDICGLDGLEKLSSGLGGRRIYISVTGKPPEAFREVLGEEAAAQITARFAGDRIEIPQHHAVLRWAGARLKNRQAKTLIYDGLSNRAVASITGLSATNVRKIRRSMDG